MMVRGRRSARGDRGAGHRRTPHPHATRIPLWKGLGADSEEKHEPVSDIDTVVVDSLKALDPEWPIREADISELCRHVRLVPQAAVSKRGKTVALFDHLVGAGAQRRRHLEAERLGGLEVGHELEPGRLYTRPA